MTFPASSKNPHLLPRLLASLRLAGVLSTMPWLVVSAPVHADADARAQPVTKVAPGSFAEGSMSRRAQPAPCA